MSGLLITKSPAVCSCVNQKGEMLHWKSHFRKSKPSAPVGAVELHSQGSLELSSSLTPPALGSSHLLCPLQAARLAQVPGRRCWHCPSWQVQEEFAVLHQGGREVHACSSILSCLRSIGHSQMLVPAGGENPWEMQSPPVWQDALNKDYVKCIKITGDTLCHLPAPALSSRIRAQT